jgi:hypothetical protein
VALFFQSQILNRDRAETDLAVESLLALQGKSKATADGLALLSQQDPPSKFSTFGLGSLNRWLWLWLLAVVTLAGSSEVRADVVVQYHCAGSLQLTNQSPPTVIQKVLALRSTGGFQNIALAKFSHVLTNSLRLGKDPSSATLIAPLFSDVVERESLSSIGHGAGEEPSFILGIHLDAQRAQLWQDNASKIFGEAGERFAIQEFSGRRWNGGGSNSFWMIHARDWLLVGCGDEFSSLQIEYLKRIKADGRPVPSLEQNWLEADITSAGLGGWFRYLSPAKIKVAVRPKVENLQLRLSIVEAEARPWKSEPWQIPKGLIQGQIISFTAGQDLAAFLRLNPLLSRLPGNPLTNQFYFWALDQLPMLNFMAWPQLDASNTLQRLSTEAPGALNRDLKRFNGTELVWLAESHKLVSRNIRLFAPTLEAVQNREGQFLLLSSFPRPPGGRPAPEALLAQVQGHTNLIYYDWEATGRRLMEWQVLRGMIANRALAQSNEAVDKSAVEAEWLSAVAPLAGDTATEVTHISPNELAVVRNAPLGLTAVELVLLADWFCGANTGPIHSPLPFGNMAPPAPHP